MTSCSLALRLDRDVWAPGEVLSGSVLVHLHRTTERSEALAEGEDPHGEECGTRAEAFWRSALQRSPLVHLTVYGTEKGIIKEGPNVTMRRFLVYNKVTYFRQTASLDLLDAAERASAAAATGRGRPSQEGDAGRRGESRVEQDPPPRRESLSNGGDAEGFTFEVPFGIPLPPSLPPSTCCETHLTACSTRYRIEVKQPSWHEPSSSAAVMETVVVPGSRSSSSSKETHKSEADALSRVFIVLSSVRRTEWAAALASPRLLTPSVNPAQRQYRTLVERLMFAMSRSGQAKSLLSRGTIECEVRVLPSVLPVREEATLDQPSGGSGGTTSSPPQRQQAMASPQTATTCRQRRGDDDGAAPCSFDRVEKSHRSTPATVGARWRGRDSRARETENGIVDEEAMQTRLVYADGIADSDGSDADEWVRGAQGGGRRGPGDQLPLPASPSAENTAAAAAAAGPATDHAQDGECDVWASATSAPPTIAHRRRGQQQPPEQNRALSLPPPRVPPPRSVGPSLRARHSPPVPRWRSNNAAGPRGAEGAVGHAPAVRTASRRSPSPMSPAPVSLSANPAVAAVVDESSPFPPLTALPLPRNFTRSLTVRVGLHNVSHTTAVEAVRVRLLQFRDARVHTATSSNCSTLAYADYYIAHTPTVTSNEDDEPGPDPAAFPLPRGLLPGNSIMFDVTLTLPDTVRYSEDFDLALPLPTVQTKMLRSDTALDILLIQRRLSAAGSTVSPWFINPSLYYSRLFYSDSPVHIASVVDPRDVVPPLPQVFTEEARPADLDM